ncbi:MAG: RNA methyltransferase [Candidatus Melainabacteria bacterium]|nr:MAG: RNA methyltransferase [Candidatus Melainabacteria bacterium]
MHTKQGRQEHCLFIAEGRKLIEEALAKGASISSVIISKSFYQAREQADLETLLIDNGLEKMSITIVDDALFQPISTLENPPEASVLAVLKAPSHNIDVMFTSETPLILILDGIQDPGNMGTMIRSALAMGVSGMIMTKGCVDPFNPKVVRGASGALFQMPFVLNLTYEQAVSACKNHKLNVVALSPVASKSLDQIDLKDACALVFGNEGNGLNKSSQDLADIKAYIPMNKASESLNVASSCAMALYETSRQRGWNYV